MAPFLSVITRHMPEREQLMRRNRASLLSQSDPDYEQIVITDDLHSGFEHARIMLIGDGDVSGALATCIDSSGVDLLMGIGGAPEGVISAAALKCMGGEIQGRLKWRNGEEKKRAEDMGVGMVGGSGKGSADLDRKLKMEDMAKGDTVMFVATGVTDGALLRGVKFTAIGCETHSIVMRSRSGTVRFIHAIHKMHVKRK